MLIKDLTKDYHRIRLSKWNLASALKSIISLTGAILKTDLSIWSLIYIQQAPFYVIHAMWRNCRCGPGWYYVQFVKANQGKNKPVSFQVHLQVHGSWAECNHTYVQHCGRKLESLRSSHLPESHWQYHFCLFGFLFWWIPTKASSHLSNDKSIHPTSTASNIFCRNCLMALPCSTPTSVNFELFSSDFGM